VHLSPLWSTGTVWHIGDNSWTKCKTGWGGETQRHAEAVWISTATRRSGANAGRHINGDLFAVGVVFVTYTLAARTVARAARVAKLHTPVGSCDRVFRNYSFFTTLTTHVHGQALQFPKMLLQLVILIRSLVIEMDASNTVVACAFDILSK
jgi:hypothetical protein